MAANAKTRRFKMVIYQRDLSRKLANQEEAIAMLRSRLNDKDWDIQVWRCAMAVELVLNFVDKWTSSSQLLDVCYVETVIFRHI